MDAIGHYEILGKLGEGGQPREARAERRRIRNLLQECRNLIEVLGRGG